MKRISLALILALLASLLGGCRYWVIEADSVQIGLGLAALAEEDASTRESEALRLHSRDENGSTRIRDAQERLIALGYLKDEPTGYLGPNTEAALAAFQKDSALSPTGLLDVRTATLLLEAAQKTENLEAVSPQITAIPVDLPLGPGSKGEAVEQIQKLLSRYGFYTGAASGSYDADTQKAVEAFQRYCVSEYGTEFDMPIASATAVPEWLPSEDQLLPAGSEPGATPTPAPERAIPLQDAPVALPTLRPGYDIDGSVSEDLYAYLTEGRFPSTAARCSAATRATTCSGSSGACTASTTSSKSSPASMTRPPRTVSRYSSSATICSPPASPTRRPRSCSTARATSCRWRR